MPHFSQENSPLKVFTPLPEGTLLATRLSGWERLGDSFEFTVSLLSAQGGSDSFSDLLGKNAAVSVTLPGGSVRHYHGEIWCFRQGNSDNDFRHHTLVLRPRLARLGLTRQSRIFQNQTALEILKVVLEPVGGADFQVRGQPPSRNYCTQYRETDLEFFLRLCFEEGIVHYWQHSADGHRLVLTDRSNQGPSLGKVEYDQTVGGSTNQPALRSWELAQTLGTTAVDLQDSHFQLFGQKLAAGANGPEAVVAGRQSLRPSGSLAAWQEDAGSGARYFDGVNSSGAGDGQALSQIYPAQDRQAQIMARAAASGSVRALAEGDCCQLAPGNSFHLIRHPDQDGLWLVVAATHTLTVQGRFWAGESSNVRCEVAVEAAPFELLQAPWPPRPRPHVGGVLTAIVIGPAGQELFVDSYGRIQVRFSWDRAEALSSCWVRVAQVWAGNTWGAAFWPRVGHEVVVAFEDGDPDRPLVVGSVYNAANMPPFPLPASKYIAGWKSLTEGGDPSKNSHQILMGDEKGSEAVLIHSESVCMIHQEKEQFSYRPSVSINLQG